MTRLLDAVGVASAVALAVALTPGRGEELFAGGAPWANVEVGRAVGDGAIAEEVAEASVAVGRSAVAAGGWASAADSVICGSTTWSLAVRTIHTIVAPTKAQSAKTPALSSDTSPPAVGRRCEIGRVIAPLPVGTSETASFVTLGRDARTKGNGVITERDETGGAVRRRAPLPLTVASA